MNKIKWVSCFFKIFFQLIFIALPVLLILGWLYVPEPLFMLNHMITISPIPESYQGMRVFVPGGHAEQVILHPLNSTEIILGFLVSTLPVIMEMFILYFLIKLFGLYEKGDIFSLNHVRYIRNIGYTLLISQLVINPLNQALMGIILTWRNPPGHGFFSVTLDHTNLGLLLTALLVVLISWIMAEGCKLSEEQQLTI